MRIDFIEIANFRKLRSVRVGLANDKTVFVGANNSGKTSAMVALRYFLLEREQRNFTLNDFTLSEWPKIDSMGAAWEKAQAEAKELPAPLLDDLLPFLDVWLHVEDDEIHYVQKILPTLEWAGGRLGVRLRFEPSEVLKLQSDYLSARAEARAIQAAGEDKGGAGPTAIWPESLTKFLERRLRAYFKVRAYVLDPAKLAETEDSVARPQALPAGSEAVDGDPFQGLIRINEISAQRGFGQRDFVDELDEVDGAIGPAASTRKLSEQLRRYYKRHLDPNEKPDKEDIAALKAIEDAQKVFDARLEEGFAAALTEMQKLGYPGVTDPKLRISTRLRPVDGLNHEAAVQYVVELSSGGATIALRLPEDSNGLGYQNLISMVFRLMSFRDAWMRVGKAQSKTQDVVEPLHLVLVEEPEAHLHTQVQQVFIRQAYKILRNHEALGDSKSLSTQLVVSTHSSHVAHECNFSSLRYFRRLPAQTGDIPISCVVNLTKVFGDEADTTRFVTRYVKVTHCDLFFADAAVLIEGPAERILVPNFVRAHPEDFSVLAECYITWLEIGGSHAHKLKELITHLGLTTLIITDLDAMDASNKSVQPRIGAGLKSRNATLKTWCPETDELDELLKKTPEERTKTYQSNRFQVRVAYQQPVNVELKGKEVTAIANTLEDALVFQNLGLFATLDGKGLIAQFRQAISDCASIDDLGAALSASLKTGSKAEFALDLLDIQDAKLLKPPDYIRDGLLWLSGQLRDQQTQLGLPPLTVEENKIAA